MLGRLPGTTARGVVLPAVASLALLPAPAPAQEADAEAAGELGAVGTGDLAAAREAEAPKDPVSPGSPLPPAEALGETFLALDRPADALAAFRTSLERWPNRYNSLLGAARAAGAAGETDEATRCRERLAGLTGGEAADAGRHDPRPE